MERRPHQVALVPIQDADQMDLQAFDKIIIGASIHYGRHNPQILTFIECNQSILDSKHNAFFSVNVVARNPNPRIALMPVLDIFKVCL